MPHFKRPSSGTAKLLVTLAVLGATASIAGLGTFATFTSSTSASHQISTGTLTLSLGTPGTSANRLTVDATDVAAGDTIQRAFDLSSSGTIDFSATPTLTTTASPSSLLDSDTTDGLQMVIDKCSVPWTEGGSAPAYTYTCGGSTSSVVASTPVIVTNQAMSNVASLVNAGNTVHLRLTLTLPSSAGNTLQGKSSTITYTFTGTQRAATNR